MKKRMKKTISILAILVLCISFSQSKYIDKISSNILVKSGAIVNNVVLEETTNTLVVGSDIVRYFTIKNYIDEDITNVSYDYYIYFLNEANEIITDVKLYRQVTNSTTSANVISNVNPNNYEELTMITEGTYVNNYYGGMFSLNQEECNFKFIIENSTYTRVIVKVKSIQKSEN